jgi:hypothetical protein
MLSEDERAAIASTSTAYASRNRSMCTQFPSRDDTALAEKASCTPPELGSKALQQSGLPGTSNPGKHDNPGSNPGNPGEPKWLAKVIPEDQLEQYLEAGWEIGGQPQNGKVAVRLHNG